MAARTQSLSFTRSIKAPASQIYHAFTNATALQEWLCNSAEAAARPEGRLYLWWYSGYYTSGIYTKAEKDAAVAFSWFGRGDPHASEVQVQLAERGEATEVTIKHSGLGRGEDWETAVQRIKEGWENGLENLQSVLETGYDLRLYNRPMVGINLERLITPEIAAEESLPVDYGVQISDAMEGMGAQALGMGPDTIIASLAAVSIRSFDDLSTALEDYKAGDEVVVVYYQGDERKEGQLLLSGRPKPDIPATAQGMAEKTGKVYARINRWLSRAFEDISEAEAAKKPAPDEWSAREVVAHLIAHENYLSTWAASLVSANESETYTPNNHLLVSAISAAYEDTPALLEGLKQAQQQNLALLGGLPVEFVTRKGSYLRLVVNFLDENIEHAKSHFKQIQARLEDARGES